MKKTKKANSLNYSPGRKNHATIKKEYLSWRQQQIPPIPLRCDMKGCIFYTAPLIWNDKELRLILDHINGVSGDNRPKNLRLLCPNCNSQLPTHGGANKGKADQLSGGFSIKDILGKKHYTLPIEPTLSKVKGSIVKIKKNLVNKPNS